MALGTSARRGPAQVHTPHGCSVWCGFAPSRCISRGDPTTTLGDAEGGSLLRHCSWMPFTSSIRCACPASLLSPPRCFEAPRPPSPRPPRTKGHFMRKRR